MLQFISLQVYRCMIWAIDLHSQIENDKQNSNRKARKIQAMIYSVELFKENLEYLRISDQQISNRVQFLLNKDITKTNKLENVRVRIVLNLVLAFNYYKYTGASAPTDLQSVYINFLLQHACLSPKQRHYNLKANIISVCLSFLKVCSPFIF